MNDMHMEYCNKMLEYHVLDLLKLIIVGGAV